MDRSLFTELQNLYSTEFIAATFNTTSFSFEVIALVMLLMASALISGSEVAFFSLTPNEVNQCRESSDRTENSIARLLARHKFLLATVLILNNLVNISIVVISTYITWQFFGKDHPTAMLMLTISTTTAIVFFGEIIPKIYAQQHAMPVAKLMTGIMTWATILTKPFAWILIKLSDVLEKGLKKNVSTSSISIEQINEVLEITTTNEPYKNARNILKGIVNFGQKSARQIMCSRLDMVTVSTGMDFHTLLQEVKHHGYSRIPVYEETIDKVIGILYAKDLLSHLSRDKDFEWQALIRKNVLFIPETKRIDSLFHDFQRRHIHMAIVVDEYGGTSGLVTLEDVIEEIVGEINDEFDDETDQPHYTSIDKNTYIFEAKILLSDFCKELNIDEHFFDTAKGESESLGGLLLELFAKMPVKGEKIKYGYFDFFVESVDRTRIKTIKVHINEKSFSTKE